MKIINALLLITLSSYSFAASSVWEISKGNNKLYIGGTVHLLAENDYPLPQEFEIAYKQAAKIIMEVDSDAMVLPENQMKMMQLMTYDDGRTLQSELSPDVYAQVLKYFSERSVPFENIQRLSAVGTSLTITILEYQLLGMKQELGVESYFKKKIENDNKKIGYLESPEEQIGFLSSLQLIPSDDLLKQSIDEVQTMPTIIKDLKASWRLGDLVKLDTFGLQELRDDFPDVYQVLIKSRNDKWLKKINNMLNDQEIELVLVGALHMAGKEGLISQLKQQGYVVKQLD